MNLISLFLGIRNSEHHEKPVRVIDPFPRLKLTESMGKRESISVSAYDFERYPTAKEAGAFCAEINPEREASYFTDVVRRLSRETEEIAHAYCPSRPNGERHVYYLEGLPDPDDARWVKGGGDKRDPEPKLEGTGHSSSKTIAEFSLLLSADMINAHTNPINTRCAVATLLSEKP